MKLGDVFKNKNPYKGEGELIFAGHDPMDKNYVKMIHACHEKYPNLNGSVQLMHIDDISKYYDQIK